jgi:hypothetical protein
MPLYEDDEESLLITTESAPTIHPTESGIPTHPGMKAVLA